MGHIPDGVFSVVGNTIKLLSGPNRTIDDLRKLSSVLLKAQQENLSKEQVEQEIEQTVPELKSISDILPKTRKELYQFLTLIIAAIALLITSFNTFKVSPPTEKQIQEMINKSIEKSMEIPSRTVQPSIENKTSPQKKIGRNQPCYCGSGKKFKKCCYLVT